MKSSSTSSIELLHVGHIARAHGLRGQVVVELVTNRRERIEPGAALADPTGRVFEVVGSFPTGTVGGKPRWVVTFAGIDSREQAEALRGTELRADALEDPGGLWVPELLGATGVDRQGKHLGTVAAVEANPASDLLVLEGVGLVPLRFVVEHTPGRLVVEVPDGLFDL